MAAGANATNLKVDTNPLLSLPGLRSNQEIPADFVEMLKGPADTFTVVPEDLQEGDCLQGVVFAFLFEAAAGLAIFLLWHLLKAIL